MALGYITKRNRGRKIHRMKDKATRVKKMKVSVFIQRGVHPTNTSDNPGYWAWACTSKHPRSGEHTTDYSKLAERRRKACGSEEFGRTPTAAMKRALVALGKKKELR